MNFVPPALPLASGASIETAGLQPVTAGACSSCVLIIDDDLGFLMWLGEVLTELGCQSVPALHCRQALTFVEKFDLPIRTLIVNLEMRGAKRAVKRIVAANPAVRIVLIRDSPGHPTSSQKREPERELAGIHVRFALERPAPDEPISRAEWLRKVRKMLL